MRTRRSVARHWSALTVLLCGAAPLSAQVWSVPGSALGGVGEAEADDVTDTTPGCLTSASAVQWLPGVLGSDLGAVTGADCDYRTPQPACELAARGGGNVRVDGVGSSVLVLRWRFAASTFHSCDRVTWFARGETRWNASLTVDIAGVAPGTPVTVAYQWRGLSATTQNPEAFIEDEARVRFSRLWVDATELTGGFFDIPGGTIVRNQPGQSGAFTVLAGAPLPISVGAECLAVIRDPGAGAFSQDESSALYTGTLVLSLVPNPPDPFPDPAAVFREFGLDLGSDREIGDANLNANGAFDPGDAYPWNGPSIPPPGQNGPRDDAAVFLGVDPGPAPLAPLGPPYCSNATLPLAFNWHDADDFDATEVSLSPVLINGPLAAPVPITSGCIYGVDDLLVSFEDDRERPLTFAAGPVCDIPIGEASPTGVVRGSSAARDEVLALSLVRVAPASWAIGSVFGVAAEDAVHPSLSPNPPAAPFAPGSGADDDVDGLDVSVAAGDCPVWYFSPDHEAPILHPITGLPLDPGTVYEQTPAGPVPAVTPAHLGLAPGVDVRAFEFVTMDDPASGVAGALAVLFGVARDDPLTAPDESGGLSARRLYASFLNGASFSVLAPSSRLSDDIDAVTAFSVPLYPPSTRPVCLGDMNCDGVVNTLDLTIWLPRFGGPGGPVGGGCPPPGADPDFNADGMVDTADLIALLGAFGRPCP